MSVLIFSFVFFVRKGGGCQSFLFTLSQRHSRVFDAVFYIVVMIMVKDV